ncbi:MAG: hypothetical protein WA210_00895 [Burkholderiaceae bacterium]
MTRSIVDETTAAMDALAGRAQAVFLRTPPGVIAAVLASLGVRATAHDAIWSDWHMLEHRGDFAACRQPADYARIWLRLKLQQVGEG